MVDMESIREAMSRVEHPSIAATLFDLGMVRDIAADEAGNVSFTLVLPFPNVPGYIRDVLGSSLSRAIQQAGAGIGEIRAAYMNESERQAFLALEHQNWRG